MRVRIPAAGAVLALALLLALPTWSGAQTPTPTPTATPVPNLPVADEGSASLGSTNPPLAVTIVVTGSQQAASDNPSFAIASYPSKGTLAPITAITCTQTVPQSGGTTSISCSAEVKYTPVANSVGTDSFTFTFSNGGLTSSAATVTITLPSTVAAPTPTPVATGTATPTPTATPTGAGAGAGTFDRALTLTGVNAAIWLGGTVSQVEAAAQAAGATSVTAYVNGQPVVLVVGAPTFVNTAFALAFPGDVVPNNTVVLVTIP